jgi:hypothetical protein
VSDGLADLKLPTAFDYNLLQDDFNTYVAANWTVGGTLPGVPALVAGAAGDGGILAIPTTAAVSETSVALPNLTITPAINKDLFVAARLKLDDAILGGFFFGIGTVAANPLGVSPTDGIYFRKLVGTFTPQVILRIGSVDVAVLTSPIDMASNTWYDLVIAYTAIDGALRAFVNDGSVRVATNPASLGGVPMSLIFSARTAATLRTLSVDNYLIAKAR